MKKLVAVAAMLAAFQLGFGAIAADRATDQVSSIAATRLAAIDAAAQ